MRNIITGIIETTRFIALDFRDWATSHFDMFFEPVSIGVVTGPLIGSQKGPLPLVASGQRA